MNVQFFIKTCADKIGDRQIDGRTDGRTNIVQVDGRKDGQIETNISTPDFVCGGYN